MRSFCRLIECLFRSNFKLIWNRFPIKFLGKTTLLPFSCTSLCLYFSIYIIVKNLTSLLFLNCFLYLFFNLAHTKPGTLIIIFPIITNCLFIILQILSYFYTSFNSFFLTNKFILIIFNISMQLRASIKRESTKQSLIFFHYLLLPKLCIEIHNKSYFYQSLIN